jgi:hypothetical protein
MSDHLPEQLRMWRPTLGFWPGFLYIVAAACGMAYWTWGTWPDVVVDFGRELYIPWQLAAGKVLYRDIAIFHGPFSQYLNTLWFILFGASLRTLVICNLAILGLLIALLCHMMRQVSRLWFTACLAFVALFAFAQYVPIGNYNYICPYAHEMTHGLMLSLASLSCVWRRPYGRLRSSVLAGGLVGMAFLTKVEVFLPGLVASLGALIALTLPTWGRTARAVVAFVAGMTMPFVIAVLLLSSAMPMHEAAKGALGSWTALAHTDPASQKYFQTGMGTDDIPGNLRAMAESLWWYALLIVPAGLIAMFFRRPSKWNIVAAAMVYSIVVAIILTTHLGAWVEIARPLPLFMLGGCVAFSIQLYRNVRMGNSLDVTIKKISLTTLALLLLAKMILNARIYHYGFVLAMPATLVVVVALVDWIPEMVERSGGAGVVVRAAGLAGLCGGVGAYLTIQSNFIALKATKVGVGADVFRSDLRGLIVNEALHAIAANGGADKTLAVLPEGVMINFLGKCTNPTPYIFFMPFDVNLFGEDQMLAAFQTNPPELVALVHKDTSEYGFRYFGQDYGQKLMVWIKHNYDPFYHTGDPPLQAGSRFGILLLRRKS